MSTPRKFYIAIHMGCQEGGAVRTLEGHRMQLAHLQKMEALRKQCAPTHWGITDHWYAAEKQAIEDLIAAIESGDIPEPHILEGCA